MRAGGWPGWQMPLPDATPLNSKSMGHKLREASSLATLHSHVLVLLQELTRLGKDAAAARVLLDLVLQYMHAHDWWARRCHLATHCLRTVHDALLETRQVC
jgi:hypothetical protein